MRGEYYVVGFDNDRNEIVPNKVVCPSANCHPGHIFALGRPVDIFSVLKSDPTIIDRLGIAGAMTEIIQQVAARQDDVGPPISTLEITPDGGRDWIDKGKCGDDN